MPYGPDKLLLNGLDFEADAQSMLAAFRGGSALGTEIIGLGKDLNSNGGIIGNKLLKDDAVQHLAEQESICEDLHKVVADCVARQRALNDRRRRWLDAEIDKL